MQGDDGAIPFPTRLPDRGRPARTVRSSGSRRAAGSTSSAGLVNQACLFGVTILLARWLGSSDVGTYAQAFAIRQILVLVALGGMRSAMTRYVAIHRADDDPAALRGTIRFGLVFTVGDLGGVRRRAVRGVRTGWPTRPSTTRASSRRCGWVAIGLPAACFIVAALSATQGFRTQRPFAFVGNMLEPILRLVLTVACSSRATASTGRPDRPAGRQRRRRRRGLRVAAQAPGPAPAGDAPLRGPRRHALRLGQLALVGGPAGAGVGRHRPARPVPARRPTSASTRWPPASC